LHNLPVRGDQLGTISASFGEANRTTIGDACASRADKGGSFIGIKEIPLPFQHAAVVNEGCESFIYCVGVLPLFGGFTNGSWD
jgi:hypothetical protein